MEQRFFVCVHCGNILTKLKDSGVPVVCCGEEMQELLPGTVDAAQEKHVPVCTADSDFVQVRVGAIDHPMLPKHHIEWIWLQTKEGIQCTEAFARRGSFATLCPLPWRRICGCLCLLQPSRFVEGLRRVHHEVCLPICGYVYDEKKEGVPFDQLPDSWLCPLCGAEKSVFSPQEMQNDPSPFVEPSWKILMRAS